MPALGGRRSRAARRPTTSLAVGRRWPLGGSSRPLRPPPRLGAESATTPGVLHLAALWACRVASAHKFSDDELGSSEAGARGCAPLHGAERLLCAARHRPDSSVVWGVGPWARAHLLDLVSGGVGHCLRRFARPAVCAER